jgi:hypothetical protein
MFCGDCAKTSARTLARTDQAASPWQRPISHFRPHPPYSPDLAPCDFFLFPKIKLKLKGLQFDTTEEIQAESPRVLDTLQGKHFQKAFQKWRRRWDRLLHTSRVMAADRPYDEFYDFYSVSPEYFGHSLVQMKLTTYLILVPRLAISASMQSGTRQRFPSYHVQPPAHIERLFYSVSYWFFRKLLLYNACFINTKFKRFSVKLIWARLLKLTITIWTKNCLEYVDL